MDGVTTDTPRQPHPADAGWHALPPEAPLAMPVQNLRGPAPPGGPATRPSAPRFMGLRRLLVIGGAVALTLLTRAPERVASLTLVSPAMPVYRVPPAFSRALLLLLLPGATSLAERRLAGVTPEQNVRAIGGNFSDNVRLGFVEQINFKRTDTASINDGGTVVNLWQQNLEAVLVEAIFGWVITDVNAFTKYTVAPAVGG